MRLERADHGPLFICKPFHGHRKGQRKRRDKKAIMPSSSHPLFLINRRLGRSLLLLGPLCCSNLFPFNASFSSTLPAHMQLHKGYAPREPPACHFGMNCMHAWAPFALFAKAKWSFCALATFVIPAAAGCFFWSSLHITPGAHVATSLWLARTPQRKESVKAACLQLCILNAS